MGFIIYVICATIVLAFLAFQGYSEMEVGTQFIAFLFMMFPFVFLPIGVKIYNKMEEERVKEELERVNNLSATEKERYYEKKRRERMNNEIDYTIIVGEDSRKSVGSAVGRGIVGGVLLGPVGLVGGAISGKNKSKTTFTIVYKSGRREVETVDNDSPEFRKYASYVR